jgi:hypothetical protein
MEDDYTRALEKTIQRKKDEIEQMIADGKKPQHIQALRDDIYRKVRTLTDYKNKNKR